MKGYCAPWFSWLVLIIGVIYALTDLGLVDFWQFNWWSVVFILCGLCGLSGKK